MYDWYDPEVPAGFQEADILQAQYEEEGRRLARDRKRGICHHGSQLGRKVPAFYDAEAVRAMRAKGYFPERETDPRVKGQETIPEGTCLCIDCGEVVEDPFA